MKVLLQRVNRAKVEVDEKVIGQIDQGLLLLVGFGQDDDTSKLQPMVDKIINLRIFSDDQSKFNLSLLDIEGGVLVVPQFTLYADARKGRRPDFTASMHPDGASSLFDQFYAKLSESPLNKVEQGIFGAYMNVELENDGPVTIMLEN